MPSGLALPASPGAPGARRGGAPSRRRAAMRPVTPKGHGDLRGRLPACPVTPKGLEVFWSIRTP